MKVFVTGASGFVGTVTTQELIKHGHKVLGMARSDASAAKLEKMGAEVIRGDLGDIDVLKQGAAWGDAILHLAFVHDFTDFAESCATDRTAILAMCDEIRGTNKPFVATSGTLFLPNDRPATEKDLQPTDPPFGLRAQTQAILHSQKDIVAMTLRLTPTVHGRDDKAFVPGLIATAREKGVSRYIGDGLNRWPSVHKEDAAVLYRLAIENPQPGANLHAVHDEGVTLKDIATTIGKHLNVPVESMPGGAEAHAHFGFLGALVGLDNPVSSAATRETFGWKPIQKGLLADLDEGHYFDGETQTNFKA